MSGRNRLLIGAAAGLAGGGLAALATWPDYGWTIHLLVSALLGVAFTLLLGDRLPSAGSALMWGQAYGLLWWLLGPLTILPMLFGDGLQWSLEHIQQQFAALPANVILFGGTLGLGVATVARVVAPDYRRKTGDGRLAAPDIAPPVVRAVVVGAVGGLLGAWLFLRGIEAELFFPIVSEIVGMRSAQVGRLLHYAIGVTIAVTFSLLFGRDIRGTGPALIYGMSYGTLWWFVGPLTLLPLLRGEGVSWSAQAAAANFAPLVAHLLYGAIVGWFFARANAVWRTLFVASDPLSRTREGVGARNLRGLLMGQAGGIVGGLLFTFVMALIGALPDVATLVGSRSPLVGLVVHLLIAVTIGSSFGLLFTREAFSYGSAMSWGLLYGLLWWLLGAMTLFPALLRQPVDWSLAAAGANYAALIGHLLYGMGLGFFFQLLARRYDAELAQRPDEPSAAPALWAATLLVVILLPLLLNAQP